MVQIALFGWPVVVVALFGLIRPRTAVLVGLLGAWLLLPVAHYTLEGIPDYGKNTAAVYGVVAGIMLFDSRRLMAFHLSWIDLPVAVWCVIPIATSLTNGLGARDGLSSTFSQTVEWGLPFFIGRLYFSNFEGLRALALGLLIGGLVYVPLCLWEVRMSPQLHRQIYGYHQHSFAQTMRFGGYRPTVFMQHGLAVGMWMSAAALVGIWLWATGTIRRLWHIGAGSIALLLTGTALICKSFGALALLILGTAALFATKCIGTRVGVAVIVAMPVSYVLLRAMDIWDGSHLVRAVEGLGVERRAGSLQYRLDAEAVLIEHAMRRPVFGWGAWDRNRPAQLGYGDDDVATDGLWVIVLGQQGIVGLVALVSMLLLPVILISQRMPLAGWSHPLTAPTAVLGIAVALFAIDCLFNAMPNPIFILAVGGLSGLVAHQPIAETSLLNAPSYRSYSLSLR